jgi:uncharacterized protein (TIGR04255 family)
MASMTESMLLLRRPPIVEAVFDFECDFAPGQSLIGLEAAAAGKFRDRYPEARKQIVHEIKIEPGADGSPVGNNAPVPSVNAFQFLQNDGKQLVQVREKGFSFNRLAPYVSLDEYLPEICRTWGVYRELAMPLLVRAVRLRYINCLNLPFTGSQLDLDSYFKVGPRMPDEDHLAFVGFLNQHQLVEKETGHHVTTVLTAGNVEGDKLPVIFDSTVAARIDSDPADWQTLEMTIQSLRSLKNRVFSETLTDKCLSLFQ